MKMSLATAMSGNSHFDVLPPRAAGTQCTRCPKAFIVDQLAKRAFDVVQTQAAGIQYTRCLKAFNADQLAMCNFDMLPCKQQCLQAACAEV